MRKLLMLSLLSLFSMFAYSQTEWTCKALSDDITKWNEIHKPLASKNKKAALALSNVFGVNKSGKLSVDYVILCNDSIGEAKIMNAVEAWIGELFPNANNDLLTSNKNDNSIVIRGMTLGKVGEATDFFSYNVINATLEVEIYVKVNRVRIIMRSNQYKVVKAMDGKIVQNYTIAMSDTYPFYQQSDHKDSYAMAYINTFSKLINTSKWLVDYLNANVKEETKSSAVGDDW